MPQIKGVGDTKRCVKIERFTHIKHCAQKMRFPQHIMRGVQIFGIARIEVLYMSALQNTITLTTQNIAATSLFQLTINKRQTTKTKTKKR